MVLFAALSHTRRLSSLKEAFQPVYWILRDVALNSLVIAVRGTFSMSDIISDVCLGRLKRNRWGRRGDVNGG